jgi:small subunit ribosomal protein S17
MATETIKQTEETSTRGRPKMRTGVVTSAKMQKTVVVRVERRIKHAKYGKYLVRHVSYKAHDESSAETRPMSKEKRWRVVETLEKAQVV